MAKPTIILDEPCAGLRDALGAIAPVFIFRRRNGFLTTHPVAAAQELLEALQAGNVAPPYVFVAASFGGFAALAFAASHPTKLVGLVLVDSSHPGQSTAALAAIPAGEPPVPAVERFKKHLEGFGPLWTESCQAIAQITDLGAVPLIVLAAGKPDMPAELSEGTKRALTQSWHALQQKHATLSTRGELRIVRGSGHNLVASAPEAIVAAVRDLVTPVNL